MRIFRRLTLITALLTGSASAQFAVIDVKNVVQTATTARGIIEQLNEFRRFAQQQTAAFEILKQNSKQLSAADLQIAWNSIRRLIEAGERAGEVLSQTKNYDRYMSTEDNSAAYELGRCYSTGCSEEEWASAKRIADDATQEERERINSETLDAMTEEQGELAEQARALSVMQIEAEGVEGQLEALMMANRYAAQQTLHLQKIQGLLALQGNAAAQQEAEDLALERRRRAAEKKALQPRTRVLVPDSPVQIIGTPEASPSAARASQSTDETPPNARAPSSSKDEL